MNRQPFDFVLETGTFLLLSEIPAVLSKQCTTGELCQLLSTGVRNWIPPACCDFYKGRFVETSFTISAILEYALGDDRPLIIAHWAEITTVGKNNVRVRGEILYISHPANMYRDLVRLTEAEWKSMVAIERCFDGC